MRLDRLGVGHDLDRPVTVRSALRGQPRRPVHRPDARTRVRRDRGRVEGRVLDVVTHETHVVLAHGFHVHQRAAVGKLERPVRRVLDVAAEVHEVVRCTDVELEVLHDCRHIARAEVHRALHAPRVDGAHGHPLLDRDHGHLRRRPARVHEWHPDAILEVSVQHPLAAEHRESPPREVIEIERGRVGAGIVVEQHLHLLGPVEATGDPAEQARRWHLQ